MYDGRYWIDHLLDIGGRRGTNLETKCNSICHHTFTAAGLNIFDSIDEYTMVMMMMMLSMAVVVHHGGGTAQ